MTTGQPQALIAVVRHESGGRAHVHIPAIHASASAGLLRPSPYLWLALQQKRERHEQMKRAAKRKPTLPAMPTDWDQGAMGAANRIGLVEEAATEFDPQTGKETPNPNGIKRQRRETWVDRYARKGKLTREQQAAALNLYAAWAGFPNRDPLAAIMAKVDGKGDNDPLASAIDKRRQFYRMWRKVPLAARPFIEHVVLDDKAIRSMAGCRDGHTEARYMARLAEGLDAIC